MQLKSKLLLFYFLCLTTILFCQERTFHLTTKVTFADEIRQDAKPDGRMFIFLSESSRGEPRNNIWPNPMTKTHIFAKNMTNLQSNGEISINNSIDWQKTSKWNLDKVPEGEYYVQILWDQDKEESRIDAPGNLYSEKQKVTLNKNTQASFVLNQKINERDVTDHDLSREVKFESQLLSDWWNKPVYLKAAILLPHGYTKGKSYPIRYNIAGYGGRYTRINALLGNNDFMKWWDSEESPQIITVFLDGEGPFGDSYQMDSENSGPYGESLIKELIPYIEGEYRGTNTSTTRFVDGCSTGGWVSLGLQLYYPDFFNGVYSYSPDAIDFENYQLVNIYKDKNVFTNEFNYPRPVMRDISGEPLLSLEEFIRYENVQGSSNTYLNSGGQFSAHTALYSPKGEDGLPMPLFDPKTGEIDQAVAEHWKKYDFKLYSKENWSSLGPKLEGKIFIWMGDMDNFYLNPATRSFTEYLETTQNPKSDAEVIFTPMQGHCWQFSHKDILLKIQEKIAQMN